MADDITPRYLIEIDEEGFPMFDGFRVNDETLLKTFFSKMRRRIPGDLRTPLVTECEKEICFTLGFSDPLVAQSVDEVGAGIWRWNFLGEESRDVALADTKVDEWQRLHTYVGAEKIPAVLSRKAQADFLNRLGATPAFSPAPWREDILGVNVDGYWTAAYERGDDRWEMGGPSPALVAEFAALRSSLKEGEKILVPGAGRGHDAVFFEHEKLAVTAVDFSTFAVAEFQKNYPHSKISFAQADLFKFLSSNPAAFGAIFEHTLFVALDPARRREYLEAVHASLKEGGYFFGVFLMRCTPPGNGAYGLTQWELRELSRDLFEVKQWHFSWKSHPKRLGNELWIVLQKKPR